MIPVLFRLGPLTVYSYGLMMALGFLAADVVIDSECRRQKINPDYASTLVVCAAVAGLIGSRLYSVIDNFQAYAHDPWSIILSGSGFVWFGGLAGGILSSYLVSRYYKVGFLRTADMAAPALAIGHALGRIGCQLSGDGDWGMPSTLPWAMAYPKAIVGWNSSTVLKLDEHNQLVSAFFPGVRVHPTPIYEALLYFGVFAFLWSRRKTNAVEGRLFFLYLVLAGACRFMVEFLRVNPRVLMGLSEAQLIALLMIAVGTLGLIIAPGASGAHREECEAQQTRKDREAASA